jgi:hypothetical protein
VKSVVCWLWSDKHLGDRPYEPKHVNTLQRMVARHLPEPHRFICIADSAEGFDPAVEVVITPPEAKEVGKLRSPEGKRFPSCYRRLWTFSKEAAALGDRVLMIDIDLVVTGDLAPLFDYQSEFVGWRPFRDWGAQMRFGGGIYLLTPGTRTHVWENFSGERSIQKARNAGFRGSDQAWISYCLAEREVVYPRDSGIYSIRDMKGTEDKLPPDARLVQFNGPVKPWASPLKWCKENYR